MLTKKSASSQMLLALLIVLLTALLGEVKITVINNSFRFGLGSATFFFLLLYYKQVSYTLIALISGLLITFFRVGLDYIFISSFQFESSFINHSPIIGYYFTFALILLIGQTKKNLDSPFYLGLLGTMADFLANIVELSIRTILTDEFLLTMANVEYVFIVAILRSYFVVGLFNMVHTKPMKAVYIEQRRRFEQVQMISSGLYVEVFYLKKLLNQIEDVTAKSFELYRKLKEYKEIPIEIATTALSVSQEVHEVKKDNQRILAGLEKIIEQESELADMSLAELVNLMVRANQKYAKMINREIEFKTNINYDLSIKKVYPFVVILNNLLANSVEAIEKKGEIIILTARDEDRLNISIIDNGIGIHQGDEEVIFEPGYTTKYDEQGRPSTGIGLSHVKTMVAKLEGEINAFSQFRKTIFIVAFPIEVLQRGDL